MFYSHEVLTSRKYGVATVWLVATLGSKSTLKKVNRKAILDVNVPKACETILAPEAPMALRLQSNLLYGVSRVYSQQCGYVLIDAQSAQNNMKALLKVIRTAELDPDAGKARPDQLILQDDPAFLPDFVFPGFDIDLSALDVSTDESSRRSSMLSSHSQQSSRSSNKDGDQSLQGLIIPTSDTGGAGDIGGFALPGDDGGSAQRGSRIGALLEEEEGGIFPDVDFAFDEEGNVIEYGAEQRLHRAVPGGTSGTRLRSDSAASARVRREHEEGFQAGQLELGRPMDLDLAAELPRYGEDFNLLPEAEPFPEMGSRAAPEPGFLKSSSSVVSEGEPSSESAEAPQRHRPKAAKFLTMDVTQELRNADLAQWNSEYLENMLVAARVKQQHKLPSQSKKNASFWVVGNGIGGVGSGLGSTKMQSPLDMFAGDKLMEALTGAEGTAAGKKRMRSSEDDGSSNEERRVKAREAGYAQVGRGERLTPDDDNALPRVGDDNDVEIGRDAPRALEDFSSQMPWNVSASIHGSRQGSLPRGRGYASSLGGFPTSAGGPSSAPPVAGIPGSHDRRGSRITSASPLVGRGLGRLSSLELPTYEGNDDLLGTRVSSSDQGGDGFQLHGPVAGADTQTADQSQLMKAALDQESFNFLEFVKADVVRKAAAAGGEDEGLSDDATARNTVSFGELLPPTEHTKVVAAQALLHVLSLASKNLITVQQPEPYGPILMGLVAGA